MVQPVNRDSNTWFVGNPRQIRNFDLIVSRVPTRLVANNMEVDMHLQVKSNKRKEVSSPVRLSKPESDVSRNPWVKSYRVLTK
jgi:hypothetical protein